ncbi:MAG: hypothetical protein CL862_13735 [Cyanobium sp. NAT70]|nr:hypothetical protein [Cyanobium sp. NAT70]|tara:strand:- start:1189 stop:1578 length:390 start_codon:yes stop_codon:yes gene_type:complete
MLDVKSIQALANEAVQGLDKNDLFFTISELLGCLKDLDPARSAFISELASKFTVNLSISSDALREAKHRCDSILEKLKTMGEDEPLADQQVLVVITMFIGHVLTLLNEYHPSAFGVMGLFNLYSSEMKH